MPNYPGASPNYPGNPHYSSAGQYHLYGGNSQSPMPGASHLNLMQQQAIAGHRYTPPAGSSSSGGRPDMGTSGMAEGSSYMVSMFIRSIVWTRNSVSVVDGHLQIFAKPFSFTFHFSISTFFGWNRKQTNEQTTT